MIDSAFTFRQQPVAGKLIMFVDKDEGRAALTKGTDKDDLSLVLIYI